MQLSIIIINYNVKYFLEQCLCSVIKAAQNITSEIFVVDNNSSDDSKSFFKGKFNSVNFIWNESNVGFAKANNIAIKHATGKYILFLNPDTIVPEDCFEKCISFFEKQLNAGALGVRMINGKGEFLKESKRSFPSPFTSLYKLSGLSWLFPKSKIFARYYLGNLSDNKNHETDVLAGAFMLTSKIIIEKAGSFDEDFFMYGEDVDLSYRIQKAGYKNFYFAETTIIHFKGESTKKGSLNYVKMFYNAMSIFVKKHYSENKAGFLNFFIYLGILFRAILSAFSRVIKGMWFFLEPFKIKNRADKGKQPTVIIGSEKEFKEVQNIIRAAGLKKKVLQLDVSVFKNSNLYDEINSFIKRNRIKEIILCEGNLSFGDVIEITKKIPRHLKVRFHSYGTEGIIGSDNKYFR